VPLVCCQMAVSTLEHLEACHWHVNGKIMHSGAGHSDWLSRAKQNCSAVWNVPRLDSNRGRVDFRGAGSFGFGAQSKFTGPSQFPSQMQPARPSVLAPSTIRPANETVWPADSATTLSAALRRESKYHAVFISASGRHVVSCADDPLHVSLARFPSLHVTASARARRAPLRCAGILRVHRCHAATATPPTCLSCRNSPPIVPASATCLSCLPLVLASPAAAWRVAFSERGSCPGGHRVVVPATCEVLDLLAAAAASRTCLSCVPLACASPAVALQVASSSPFSQVSAWARLVNRRDEDARDQRPTRSAGWPHRLRRPRWPRSPTGTREGLLCPSR